MIGTRIALLNIDIGNPYYSNHLAPSIVLSIQGLNCTKSYVTERSLMTEGLFINSIGWLNVRDSGISNPRQQRISTIAQIPKIRCFVAKLHLSQFSCFLAVIFLIVIQIDVPLLLNSQNIFAEIEHIFFGYNRLAIFRTD